MALEPEAVVVAAGALAAGVLDAGGSAGGALATGVLDAGVLGGEVLVPALSPFSFKHSDDAVRLGRVTVWEDQEGGEVVPFGQKTLVVDGEDFPLLELRRLEIAGVEEAPQSHATTQ